jgi:proteasome lid subunit RPN8/RPN11
MSKQGITLQITRKHLLEMIAHAREEAPNEACGILAGNSGRVLRLYRTANAALSPTAYRLHPDEQYRIFRDIEDRGLEILGIYHSHPSSSAIPSETDIRQAYSSEVSCVMISLRDPADPQVRAFRITEDGFDEQDVLVI